VGRSSIHASTSAAARKRQHPRDIGRKLPGIACRTKRAYLQEPAVERRYRRPGKLSAPENGSRNFATA